MKRPFTQPQGHARTLRELARGELACEGSWLERVKAFCETFHHAYKRGQALEGWLADAPPAVNPIVDAYLGAVAQHLSQHTGLATPEWALQPNRYLKRPWFGAAPASMKPSLVVESPAAFRARMLFVSAKDARLICHNWY